MEQRQARTLTECRTIRGRHGGIAAAPPLATGSARDLAQRDRALGVRHQRQHVPACIAQAGHGGFCTVGVVGELLGEPALGGGIAQRRLARLSQTARDRGFVAWPIGTVSGQPSLRVRVPGGTTLAWDVVTLAQASSEALQKLWNEEGV